MSERAIRFSSSNAIQGNVIYQKFTTKINNPVTADITFAITDKNDGNIPNSIDYKEFKLKLKSKSYKYPNIVENCVIEVRAFYEQDINLNFNLDFSEFDLNYDEKSNYYKYYNLSDVRGQIESETGLRGIPNWRVYVDDEKNNLISFSNILNEIISKGGYYIDYEAKTFNRFNPDKGSNGSTIRDSDLLDSTTITFTEKDESDLQDELYIISKPSEQEKTEFEYRVDSKENEQYTITENPDDAENPSGTVKVLDTIDQNFDASGQTKEKKEITYIDDTPIEEKYWRFGFAFEAKDALKEFCYTVQSTGDEICAEELYGDPKRFWQVVEYRHTKYDYSDSGTKDNDYNYLIGIDTTGWKLGRFRVESQYSYESGRGWETKNLTNDYLRKLYEFQKFPLKEITRNNYFPHAAYYKYEDVSGRKVEDVYHIVKEYDKENNEIETRYEKREDWFEPMFLGGRYHYSSCFAFSYNKYRDKDGNLKVKNKQLVQPDIFGQIKEYKTDITIYTNKQNVSSTGLGLKPNFKIIKPEQEPYYMKTTKIFQTQNENYNELAEKTEFSRSSGIPPIGERLQKKNYEYTIQNTTEERRKIPDLSEEKIIKYEIYTDSKNKKQTNATYIKPNDYNFEAAKNLQYLQQQASSKIKLKNDNFNLEDIVTPNFASNDYFIVDEKSEIVDTRDKFSNGFFPSGDKKAHEYSEIGIKIYKKVYSVNKIEETPDQDDDDDDPITLPVLDLGGIGYDRQTILNEMSRFQQRGNMGDENRPRNFLTGNNEDNGDN